MSARITRPEHFSDLLRREMYTQGGADPGTALADLLADAMHFAEDFGVDFERAMERAVGYFEMEDD